MFNNYQPILFYAYIIISIIFNIYGWVIIISGLAKEKTPLDTLNKIRFKLYDKKSLFFKAREIATSFLENIVAFPHWLPISIASVIDGARGKKSPYEQPSTRGMIHAIQLMVFDKIIAIYSALSAIIIYFIYSEKYLKWSMYIILIPLLARHIKYLIEPNNLPKRLRRSLKRPYSSYIVILIFDIISLVLIHTYIQHSNIDYTYYAETFKKLFGFRDLMNFLQGASYTYQDWIIGISGLLLYLSLVRMIFSYKSFKKTDEDCTWLAKNHLQRGEYYRALDSISDLKRLSDEDYQIKIIAYCGVNNLDGARELAKDYLKIHTGNTPTENDIFQIMIAQATSAYMGNVIYGSIIVEAINGNVDDYLIHDMSSAIFMSSNNLRRTVLHYVTDRKNEFPLTYFSIIRNDNPEEALRFIEKISEKSEGVIFILANIFRLIMTKELKIGEDNYVEQLHNISTKFFQKLKTYDFVNYTSLELAVIGVNLNRIIAFEDIDNIYKQQTAHLIGETRKLLLNKKDGEKYLPILNQLNAQQNA